MNYFIRDMQNFSSLPTGELPEAFLNRASTTVRSNRMYEFAPFSKAFYTNASYASSSVTIVDSPDGKYLKVGANKALSYTLSQTDNMVGRYKFNNLNMLTTLQNQPNIQPDFFAFSITLTVNFKHTGNINRNNNFLSVGYSDDDMSANHIIRQISPNTIADSNNHSVVTLSFDYFGGGVGNRYQTFDFESDRDYIIQYSYALRKGEPFLTVHIDGARVLEGKLKAAIINKMPTEVWFNGLYNEYHVKNIIVQSTNSDSKEFPTDALIMKYPSSVLPSMYMVWNDVDFDDGSILMMNSSTGNHSVDFKSTTDYIFSDKFRVLDEFIPQNEDILVSKVTYKGHNNLTTDNVVDRVQGRGFKVVGGLYTGFVYQGMSFGVVANTQLENSPDAYIENKNKRLVLFNDETDHVTETYTNTISNAYTHYLTSDSSIVCDIDQDAEVEYTDIEWYPKILSFPKTSDIILEWNYSDDDSIIILVHSDGRVFITYDKKSDNTYMIGEFEYDDEDGVAILISIDNTQTDNINILYQGEPLPVTRKLIPQAILNDDNDGLVFSADVVHVYSE